jgi:hypothetical protein
LGRGKEKCGLFPRNLVRHPNMWGEDIEVVSQQLNQTNEREWAQRIVRPWRSIAGVGLVEFFFWKVFIWKAIIWKAFIRRMGIIVVPPLGAGTIKPDNVPSRQQIAS